MKFFPDLRADSIFVSGLFVGQNGYASGGETGIILTAAGKLEIRMAGNFYATESSGSTLILTQRAVLGSSIEPTLGDVEIGPLKRSAGVQSYPIGSDGGRRHLAIFDKFLNIEIAHAVLK